jgi:twitching motility two-component system response regulator PilH
VRGIELLRHLFKSAGNARPVEFVERRKSIRVHAPEGLRILVVDDSSTIVALLSRMLQQNGYRTFEATSGEEAIALIERELPDLVFLDIVLPGMSGFAVLRSLRRESRTHHLPVIMISGNLRATEEFYGQRIGADEFMKKPFSRFDVFERIKTLVERGRLPHREPPGPEIHDDAGVDEEVHDDTNTTGSASGEPQAVRGIGYNNHR